jgi:DhnA family fructose-bisphosphate aldolase class Ia
LIRLRLQLGLIARYGIDYPDVPYLVKLNSMTNLVETSQRDPSSSQWVDMFDLGNIEQVRSAARLLARFHRETAGWGEEARSIPYSRRI